MDGISKKVLIDSLRALERDGMVECEDVHYQLTALGRTLHEPLQALQVWAESYVDDVQAAQDRYDEAADDQTLRRISND